MAAAGPIISGISSISPVLSAVSTFSTLLGGAPDSPSAAPAPAAPSAVAAPAAPETSSAADVASSPVVDTEAARVRAQKRRSSAEQRKLFSLSEEDSESTVLTKSLLGE